MADTEEYAGFLRRVPYSDGSGDEMVLKWDGAVGDDVELLYRGSALSICLDDVPRLARWLKDFGAHVAPTSRSSDLSGFTNMSQEELRKRGGLT